MLHALSTISPSRWIAVALALATLPCAWYSGPTRESWGILFGAVAPGIAFFLIWAIPFDMLMTRVFMSDSSGEHRRQLKAIVALDAVILGLLLMIWGSIFINLVTR